MLEHLLKLGRNVMYRKLILQSCQRMKEIFVRASCLYSNVAILRIQSNMSMMEEFYLCFFARLGNLHLKTLNYSFQCGKLRQVLFDVRAGNSNLAKS